MSQSFGIPFGMDQAHLTCHLSGVFTGLLDVHRMLGELIVLDRGVRSLALLGGAFAGSPRGCLSIHL